MNHRELETEDCYVKPAIIIILTEDIIPIETVMHI